MAKNSKRSHEPVMGTVPRVSGPLINLNPTGAPSGYPEHGQWVEETKDKSGKPKVNTHRCGGLLMLPEEAGMRSPVRTDPDKHAVTCTQCTKRHGQLVLVGDELWQRVLAVSGSAGARRGQLGAKTIYLAHLTKPARQVLYEAFHGRTDAVKNSPAKPFFECVDHGLVTIDYLITEAGLSVGGAAGWTKQVPS